MGTITFFEKLYIPRYDNPKKIKQGVICINQNLCKGCKFCSKACPTDSIFIEEKKAQTRERYACMFCGDCAAICKENAIELVSSFEYSGYYKTIDSGKPAFPRL